MIDSDCLDLIEKELDGTASPKEKERLFAYLASHPEARAYYEVTAGIAAALSDVPMAAPPSGFKTRVMIAIDERSVPMRRRKASFRFPASFGRESMALRLSGAFACGAVVGCLLLALVTGLGPSRSALHGVAGMIPPDPAEQKSQEADVLTITLAGCTGTAITRPDDGSVVVEVSLIAKGETHLTLRSENGLLSPTGFATLRGPPSRVLLEKDGVSVVLAGESAFRMTFSGEDGERNVPLIIHVSEGGETFDGSIGTTGPLTEACDGTCS